MLTTYNDMRRCPYPAFTEDARDWIKREDKRILINALEKYVAILDYMITNELES